jgi:hypothetical protein
MKTSQLIWTISITTFVVAFLIGFGFALASICKNEPTGTFTAQDMNEYSNYTHKIGAEQMRQVIKELNTDTTVKACQVRD